MQDVEALRDQGLALGGSLENAIVMDEYRVLNSDGLRYADEFVKHKILDAIGDLYLAGHPLLGAFAAHKSGHALNNLLLRACWPMPRPGSWSVSSGPRKRRAASPGCTHNWSRAMVPVLLLRIVGILTAITIGSGIVAWLFTRDRRYLVLSARVAKGRCFRAAGAGLDGGRAPDHSLMLCSRRSSAPFRGDSRGSSRASAVSPCFCLDPGGFGLSIGVGGRIAVSGLHSNLDLGNLRPFR
jgi:hypothetical protein